MSVVSEQNYFGVIAQTKSKGTNVDFGRKYLSSTESLVAVASVPFNISSGITLASVTGAI